MALMLFQLRISAHTCFFVCARCLDHNSVHTQGEATRWLVTTHEASQFSGADIFISSGASPVCLNGSLVIYHPDISSSSPWNSDGIKFSHRDSFAGPNYFTKSVVMCCMKAHILEGIMHTRILYLPMLANNPCHFFHLSHTSFHLTPKTLYLCLNVSQ